MNHRIKELSINLLAGAGAFPARATSVAEVRALVDRLRPLEPPGGLIRLGAAADGGYLVPDDLRGIVACFSPGVSTLSDFERACADQGIQCFLADRSVDGPAVPHPLFAFERKHLGAMNGPDTMTLDDWVGRSMPDCSSDLLLQMDIEGAEYETLIAAPERLMRRFRIIVVEFHGLQDLWNKPWFDLASRAFDRLLQFHACVHIHPNNCYPSFRCRGLDMPCVAELTFLRRDRFGTSPPRLVTSLPHPLDRDNTDAPPVVLGREWFGAASA
jgi:hypothetical protein